MAGIFQTLRRWAEDGQILIHHVNVPNLRGAGQTQPGVLGTRIFTGLYRVPALHGGDFKLPETWCGAENSFAVQLV